jgi:hypothetical protein
MRVGPCFALLFLLLCFSTENIAKSAIIDPRSINTSDTTLGAFEERLFFHQYKTESVSKRLSRLETSVFGTTYNGMQESERFTQIAQALPSIQKPKAQKVQQQKQAIAPAYNEYPAVADMETSMIGRTFASEAIAARLDRLENKQFGRTSNSTDLALRVDNLKRSQMPAALMQNVQEHIATARLRLAPSSVMRTRENRQTTVADRIEIMEKNVFGRIYPERPLQKRVNALEKNIYGEPQLQANGALTDRVAQLWMKVTGTGDFRIIGSARG